MAFAKTGRGYFEVTSEPIGDMEPTLQQVLLDAIERELGQGPSPRPSPRWRRERETSQ